MYSFGFRVVWLHRFVYTYIFLHFYFIYLLSRRCCIQKKIQNVRDAIDATDAAGNNEISKHAEPRNKLYYLYYFI